MPFPRSKFLFLLIPHLAFAGIFHETRTVGLLEMGLVAFDFYQKLYLKEKDKIFLREQSIFLSLGKKSELGIHIPYINSLQSHANLHRFGDMRLSLNWATNFFKPVLLTNFYLEYNFGTGPNYREFSTNKMEAYGYPEFRLGPIFLKKWEFLYFHFNFFYVFRAAKDDGDREKTLFDGFDFNIIERRAWQRWLGFNPRDSRNFFYYQNFDNDILEYNLALSSDLFYPFVWFSELTFSNDFRAYKGYVPEAPGSGMARFQYILGLKFFMSDDHFALKTALVFPIGKISQIYDIGFSLGARLEF